MLVTAPTHVSGLSGELIAPERIATMTADERRVYLSMLDERARTLERELNAIDHLVRQLSPRERTRV